MDDIVARVREECFIGLVPKDKAEIFLEAADEIESLRVKLYQLRGQINDLFIEVHRSIG